MLLRAQLDALATWLVNPWFFVAGAAAVLLPILIHLLNKRRFQVVDWAAMEFLLEADKQNRRRIRLENLLLLLLRCLAVLLIGLLLARPFFPTSVTAGLIDAAQFERIVVLDDSLSMQTRLGNESAWEVACGWLSELATALAAGRGDNSLTLILTSEPDRRLLNAAPLNSSSLDEIRRTIEKLAVGDGIARLGAALDALNKHVGSQPANVNRVVYLLTDLRQPDWELAAIAVPTVPAHDAHKGTVERLKRLARQVQGCYVIDAAEDDDRNLSIVEVRPEGMLIEGVQSAFDVAVMNQGSAVASDVRVRMSSGESLPVEATIERLGPQERASIRFNFLFTRDEQLSELQQTVPPRRIKAELQTPQQGADDRLAADSIAYYPARLARGIPVLIVDGEASAEFRRAESFYLRRALAPPGPVPSGTAVEVVTDSELDALDLNKYQVIFLLNNYRLGEKTEENIARLEKWVAAGGGLVIMPGDQIDEQHFNRHYWRDGAGLSPLRLETVRGDETEATWVQLRALDANHAVLKQFAGQDNPLLASVKVFRWWHAVVKSEQLGKAVSVVARLSDVDDSPAIAERALRAGRVVAFSVPADAAWHNWANEASYLLIMQDLVRYLAAPRGSRGLVRVGEPIRESIDLTQYEIDATLSGPRELKVPLQATPVESESGSSDATTWHFHYPAALAQGFYELTLSRRDGGSETRLFAANVDPAEGNLQRVDRRALAQSLAGTNVQVVGAAEMQSLADAGSQTEGWRYLLWAVVGLLAGEQLLGWFFGRQRS